MMLYHTHKVNRSTDLRPIKPLTALTVILHLRTDVCRERTSTKCNFDQFQALSGVDEALKASNLLENTALQSALDTQFLLQIGVFTAVPMIVNFILEQGVLRVRDFINLLLNSRFSACGLEFARLSHWLRLVSCAMWCHLILWLVFSLNYLLQLHYLGV